MAGVAPRDGAVWFRGGGGQVWGRSREALGTPARVADVAGLDVDNVTVQSLLLGGGFGRRIPVRAGRTEFPSEIDWAVMIARQVDAPVKLLYTREDDIQHDAYRPAVTSHLRAVLGPARSLTAWYNRHPSNDDPTASAQTP